MNASGLMMRWIGVAAICSGGGVACGEGSLGTDGVDFSRLPATWPPPLVAGGAMTEIEDRKAKSPAATSDGVKHQASQAAGFRVNLAAKTVEFDGVVIVNVHDPQTPRVYIEALVCRPDSMEHESLVMTTVSARMVHAGLLAIGLNPGAPGSIVFEPGTGRLVSRAAPTGDEVIVELGVRRETAQQWSANEDVAYLPITSFLTTTQGPLNLGAFVFAGSRTVDEAEAVKVTSIREQAAVKQFEPYLADAIGSVVGLHTFGVETIANTAVLSPDSGADAPYIIADRSLPTVGTPVTIRIRPAKK